MDLPKKFARRGIVLYLHIAAAVVSILLGLAQMTKESQPFVEKYQENRQQALLKQQQEEAARRAGEIAGMAIHWQYRGNDGTWRFYSDQSGRYWCCRKSLFLVGRKGWMTVKFGKLLSSLNGFLPG